MANTRIPSINSPTQQLVSLRSALLPVTLSTRHPATSPPPLLRCWGRHRTPFSSSPLCSAASGDGVERSWGGELPDWELEPYSSYDEVEDEVGASIFSDEEDGGGSAGGLGFKFQNALAAVLVGALALSVGNVFFKLVVVAAALASAAVRYSAIGFLIVIILVLIA